MVSIFVLIDMALPGAVLRVKSCPNHGAVPAWVDRLPSVEELIDAVADASNDLIGDLPLLTGTFAYQIAIIRFADAVASLSGVRSTSLL